MGDPHSRTDGQQSSFTADLRALYRSLPRQRRWHFALVLALMILSALAEFATVGAVVPFLSLLARQEQLDVLPGLASLMSALGAQTASDRLLVATILFGTVVAIAGIVRLLLGWTTQSFAFGTGHDLTVDIHRRMLRQPYSFHLERNSADLLAGLHKVESLVWDLVLQLMLAISAFILSLAIVFALLAVDPFAALAGVGIFASLYLVLSAFARRALARNSRIIGQTWSERIKIVQESLGSIRDVIIDGQQRFYGDLLSKVDFAFSKARVRTAIISTAPRFLIETAGTILIALVALAVAQRQGGLAPALPVLGALALGAQRMMPLLQQIYQGWSLASGHRSLLSDVLGFLQLPAATEESVTEVEAPQPLREGIKLEDVAFGYAGQRGPALKGASFAIRSGATVALVGRTGSGKSTLADLIMGLVEPTEGRILVDGVPLNRGNAHRWHRNIAHVPQSIFLSDASIARNIAFGMPAEDVDMARVQEAAELAQIADFIDSLPHGYDTMVGERGVRLSGGQRQRLGIARALYKQAQLLVLDEATSALDTETEDQVLAALRELASRGVTILVIAHRLSPALRYDLLVRLENGRLVECREEASDEAAGGARVR